MGEKNGYAFSACMSCGSVITEPWVTQKTIDDFFGDVQPDIVHLPKPDIEIQKIKKTLMGMVPSPAGKKFLDVSCRQGYAVMAAKELGLEARGIDRYDFFVTFAQDKYTPDLFEQKTAVEAAAHHPAAFDFIFASEAFCEQTDPENFAEALAALLKPDGILYIHEIDGNHFMLPRKFSKWLYADPPLNFAYYSKKGMEALLSRHGLVVQKSFFNWRPFMRLIVKKKK